VLRLITDIDAPTCISGLYLNVAKRVATQDAMGNSKDGSKRPDNRMGKIFLDPQAAPYSTMRGNQPVHIHPSSVLFSNPSGRKLPEYVVFAELLITTKHYMRNVTAVDGSWLMELAPNLFKRAVEAN
jgi:HrpA-like RNA helicase